MSRGVVTFQIGKAGINPALIEQLNNLLEHHKHIRISALPSSRRNRDSIHQMAEKLTKNLSSHCEYRIIGFTIALRKRSLVFKSQK